MNNPMKSMSPELRRRIGHDALVQLGWQFYQRDGKWWCFAKINDFEKESPEGCDSQDEIIDLAVSLAMHAVQYDPLFAIKFISATARMVMAHRDDMRAAYEQNERQEQPAAATEQPGGEVEPGSKAYLLDLVAKYGIEPMQRQ